MQRNIDEKTQRQRRQDAWKSTVLATAGLLLSAAVLMLLRYFYVSEGFWRAVLLGASVLELGTIVPVWILLKERLKEIEGGEEDAAAQY